MHFVWQGYTNLVKLLVDHSADIDALNNDNESPCAVVKEKGNIYKDSSFRNSLRDY